MTDKQEIKEKVLKENRGEKDMTPKNIKSFFRVIMMICFCIVIFFIASWLSGDVESVSTNKFILLFMLLWSWNKICEWGVI